MSPLPLIESLPLYDLQTEASALLAVEQGGIIWWKVGEGKTRVALAAFIRFLRFYYGDCPDDTRGETSQLEVICRPAAFYDWYAEAELLGIRSRVHCRSFGRLSTQSADAEVKDIVSNPRIKMVVLDELYLYKGLDSKRGDSANRIALAKPTIGLSGSIMPAKRLEDVYGQARAVNKHKRIARNVTAFREEFMNGVNDFGGVRYHPKRGAYDALMHRCVGDPETRFAHIHMPLKGRRIHESVIQVNETSQQAEYFQQIRMLMEIPDFETQLTNNATLITKIQQLANGWFAAQNERIYPVASEKPSVCLSKVEELSDCNERCVVWCAFRHDVELLASLCKIPYVTFRGGEPFNLARWQSKQPQVCFATEASGSSVNHFKDCAYALYFSMSQKPLDFQQSRGRTDRKDSDHDECFYLHFHVRDSLDEAVLRAVRQGVSAEGAMLQLGAAKQNWLRGLSLKEEDNGIAA